MIKDNPKMHHCIGKGPKSPVCVALGKPAWTVALVATAAQAVCQTPDSWPSCCRGWLCNSLRVMQWVSRKSWVGVIFDGCNFAEFQLTTDSHFPALKRTLLHTGVPSLSHLVSRCPERFYHVGSAASLISHQVPSPLPRGWQSSSKPHHPGQRSQVQKVSCPLGPESLPSTAKAEN